MPEGAPQEERTEAATPRRKEETRKKGQVAKSQDLTSACMFLIGLTTIRYVFPRIFMELMNIMKVTFSHISDAGCSIANDPTFSIQNTASRTTTSPFYYSISVLVEVGKNLAPYAIIMFISALIINFAQVGFLISGEALMPKYSRIDPFKGITRLISKKTIVSLIQSLFKITIVGYVLYITVKGEQDIIASLADMSIKTAIAQIASLIFKMGFRAALLLFLLAAFDYAYQRWEHERSIRMTKQEVKEEMRQSEGDPLVKSRIRSIQRELAMKRMMQEIPTADVIITNPTHLAVALKFDIKIDAAPKVCAKGARLIAERIKAIAREHNIPIVEDKLLARALYELELGQEIPEVLYKAIAEILSSIYQLN